MKKAKEHIKDLLPAYIDGVLNEEEMASIDAHLNNCTSCAEELKQLRTLFSAIEKETITKPSDNIRANFLEALELEKQGKPKVIELPNKPSSFQKNWPKYVLKVAASIALLAGAFMVGKLQQAKRSDMDIATLETETLKVKQTAMLSLIDNQSASKRIQGVSLIAEFENPDEAIVEALVNRMLLDENINVRLTAVEALAAFAKSETVKSGFIKALATEKDPSVQIAIIENLVRIQARKAAAPMKELLEQEDTQPFVKDEINRVLSQII